MKSTHNNLEEERQNIAFNINDLSLLIYGSQDRIDRFLTLRNHADNSALHQYNPDGPNLSRFQKMQCNIKQFHDFYKNIISTGKGNANDAYIFFNEPMITNVHQVMFIPCLKNFSDSEQYKKW